MKNILFVSKYMLKRHNYKVIFVTPKNFSNILGIYTFYFIASYLWFLGSYFKLFIIAQYHAGIFFRCLNNNNLLILLGKSYFAKTEVDKLEFLTIFIDKIF